MTLRFRQPFEGSDQIRFRSTTARQTSTTCGTITVSESGDGDGGGDGGTQPGDGGTQPDPPIPGGLSTAALGGGALLLLLVGFLLTQ